MTGLHYFGVVGGGGDCVCDWVAVFVGGWGMTGLHFMGDCVCDGCIFIFCGG